MTLPEDVDGFRWEVCRVGKEMGEVIGHGNSFKTAVEAAIKKMGDVG